jgi:hypothetical protein
MTLHEMKAVNNVNPQSSQVIFGGRQPDEGTRSGR